MSFASLKKASSAGNTFAKLTREIEKLNQPAAGSSADERFWKPEMDKSGNGYAVIRFLLHPMAKKCHGQRSGPTPSKVLVVNGTLRTLSLPSARMILLVN